MESSSVCIGTDIEFLFVSRALNGEVTVFFIKRGLKIRLTCGLLLLVEIRYMMGAQNYLALYSIQCSNIFSIFALQSQAFNKYILLYLRKPTVRVQRI